MSEVECSQPFQTADLTGELGQVVVGQDQRVDVGLLPHRIWYLAEVLLPEIEV